MINGKISSSPKEMSDEFNHVFIDKVKKLKDELNNSPVTENPEERLRKWLDKRESPIPLFQLKPIDIETLEKYIKKM